MKCTAVLIVMLLLILAAAPATTLGDENADKLAEHAVVKITAVKGNDQKTGSGFAWRSPTYVITAAHVVAGVQVGAGYRNITVYSYASKKETKATPVAVLLNSDLALLELESDIQLQPLKSAVGFPTPYKEYVVWGYPDNEIEAVGHPLKLTHGPTIPTSLNSLFNTPGDLRDMVKGSWPAMDAQIIRISTVVRHGGSGGPIVDEKGALVGIVDGGLQDGLVEKNWAMPGSSALLQKLQSSPDHITELQTWNAWTKTAAMSSDVQHPVEVKRSAPDAQPQNGKSEALRLILRARLGDILDTLSGEEQKKFAGMRKSAGEADFDGYPIDVYEDRDTGATIGVPEGIPLTFNQQTGKLHAIRRFKDGINAVEMTVQIEDGDSVEDAATAWKDFDQHINTLAVWQKPADVGDIEHTRDAGSFHSLAKRRDEYKDGEVVGRMIETLVVDGGGFLGTFVQVTDRRQMTPEDKTLANVMAACAQLADFSN